MQKYTLVMVGKQLQGMEFLVVKELMNYDMDMPGYIKDIADWLNKGKVHPLLF